MPVQRTYSFQIFQAAATAEGLTTTQAKQALRSLDEATRNGMIAFVNTPEAQGLDEAGWRAAFPAIPAGAAGSFIIRVAVILAGGEVV